MYEDLITERDPPPNRVKGCDGAMEHHLSEGAVMLAFAMHLLRTVRGLREVTIHPDGEHGKRFEFETWLKKQGFLLRRPMGTTRYGGLYEGPAGATVTINPSAGRGDVVATMGQVSYVAECKGGVINTKHAGQLSRVRRGLCETVGMLLAGPIGEHRKQFAVVPHTKANGGAGAPDGAAGECSRDQHRPGGWVGKCLGGAVARAGESGSLPGRFPLIAAAAATPPKPGSAIMRMRHHQASLDRAARARSRARDRACGHLLRWRACGYRECRSCRVVRLHGSSGCAPGELMAMGKRAARMKMLPGEQRELTRCCSRFFE